MASAIGWQKHLGCAVTERQRLLWLWSEAYYDWGDDDGDFPAANLLADAVATELYDRLCSVASDEELAIDPNDIAADEEPGPQE